MFLPLSHRVVTFQGGCRICPDVRPVKENTVMYTNHWKMMKWISIISFLIVFPYAIIVLLALFFFMVSG